MAQLQDLTYALNVVLLAAAEGNVEDASALLTEIVANPITTKLLPTFVVAMDEMAKQYDSIGDNYELSSNAKISANLDALT